MSRSPKCCKHPEAGEQERIDRISSLPDELIGQILSFLPTECAVGTSILSSRWRCLHMLVNCLSFVSHVDGKIESNTQKTSFMIFVNRVLLFHKVSPIKKFHLDCGRYTYNDSLLHAWISVALSKGVEELYLFLNNGTLHALPRSLFSCQTIVELNIESSIDDFRVPESIHLPRLKILHLQYFNFLDRDSFRKLFSACPLLQVLEMKHCQWPRDSVRHVHLFLGELKRLTILYCAGGFEVDAPKLVYLYLCYTRSPYFSESRKLALSLKNPDCIVTAHLELSFFNDVYEIQHSAALFKAVHHVKELYLRSEAIEYLVHSEDDHLTSYTNLVKLSIGGCSYHAWKYVTDCLANLPRLETLVFNMELASKRGEKWPTNVALVTFSSSVKVIEVYNFRGYTTELVLLKYLLGNADQLNRLILHKHYMTEKQLLQAHTKLLRFPRASKTCDVQLL